MYDWVTRLTWFIVHRKHPGLGICEDKEVGDRLSDLQSCLASTEDLGGRSGLPRKEARNFATHLEGCMSAVVQACSAVEADFLAIGGQLQAIYEQASQMTRTAQAAVGRMGLDGEDTTLGAIIRTAYSALSDLKLERTAMAERMHSLRTMCEDLAELRSLTSGLGRIAKSLKMVAININIESSRAAESWDSFSVLSQEIRILSNTVSSLERVLVNEILAMTRKLQAMQQVMGAKFNRFVQLADEARAVADRAEPECRALINQSVSALQQVSADGEAISCNTSRIVVDLQIHDNVSQRIAHIADALADSHQLARQLEANTRSTCDTVDPLTAIDANLGLQLAQLSKIITDIEQAYQNSRQAFVVIGDAVKAVNANVNRIARGDKSHHSGSGGRTGSIGSLQAALEKIHVLLGQGDEAVEELKTIGRDATTTVSRIGELMEQIRKVNFDIHLKSLNAILKSTHLGVQGRAIGVLVQEMKDLATQSRELVEQIESINATIMTHAGELQEHLSTGSPDRRDKAIVTAGDLEASIREFSAASEGFACYADEMDQQSQTLATMIVAAGNQLAFLSPFEAQLRSQQQQLKECRDRMAPWVPAVSGKEAALDQARLADRYTMQQERDIHLTALDSGITGKTSHPYPAERPEKDDGQEPDMPPDSCMASEESEFGENVELF